MEDLKIVLPCGFKTEYKNLKEKHNILECLICKEHKIDVKKCLEKSRRRFFLKQNLFDNQLEELNKFNFDEKRKLFIDSIEKEYEKRKKDLEIHKAELKAEIEAKLDKMHSDLLKLLTQEKISILKRYEEGLNKITSIQIDPLPENIDSKSKSEMIETNLNRIKHKTSLVNNFLKIENTLKLVNNYDLNLYEFIKKFYVLNSQLDKSIVKLECNQVFNSHTDSVTDIKILDENKALSCSNDSTIKLWNMETGECTKTYTLNLNFVNCLCVVNNVNFLSSSSDYSIRLWSVNSKKCLKTFEGHSQCVMAIQIKNSNEFISGSHDGNIILWNFENEKPIKTYEVKSAINYIEIYEQEFVLCALLDCTIIKLELKNGSVVKTYTGHEKAVWCLKIMNENYMASGSLDETIRIWQIESGLCVKIFYGHTSGVTRLGMINENILFSGSWDATIRFWNIENSSCMALVKAHKDRVYSLDCTKFGIVASASKDKSVKIWNFPKLNSGVIQL